jgi:ribonuclease BN (tRNA processing enzyme)
LIAPDEVWQFRLMLMCRITACLMLGSLFTACFGQGATTGTRLITLGTAGGPLPVKDRTQSSNLLIVNGTRYLIDAGDDVTRRIVQSGSDFRQVGKVFITHAHSDHTMGLATLMVSAWEFPRRESMEIYGPPGIEALVSGALRYLTVNTEIRSAEGKPYSLADLFQAHDVLPGLIFQDRNVKVTAIENTHFHFPAGSLPYGKYKSYSYRFDTADRVVIFTGDSGPSEVLVDLAKGADVLVMEVVIVDDALEVLKRNGSWQARTPESQKRWMYHMTEEHITPENGGKIAAKAGVKTLIMSHLPPTINPKDDYQRYVDAAKKYFSGRIIVAKDLMEF